MGKLDADQIIIILVRAFFGALMGLLLAGVSYLVWQSPWVLPVVPISMLCTILFGDDFYRWLMRIVEALALWF